jgi:hypothetical protein
VTNIRASITAEILGIGPELRIANLPSSNANSLCGQHSGWIPESVRPFKEIIWGNVSEFESHMPSQPVQSSWAMSAWQEYARHFRNLPPDRRVSEVQFPRQAPFDAGHRRATGPQRRLARPTTICRANPEHPAAIRRVPVRTLGSPFRSSAATALASAEGLGCASLPPSQEPRSGTGVGLEINGYLPAEFRSPTHPLAAKCPECG